MPRILTASALLSASLTAGWAAAQHATSHTMPMTPPARTAGLPLTAQGARVVAVPPGIQETSAFVTLRNTGRTPIVITGASSDAAGMVMLMNTYRNGALTGMRATAALTVPAGGSLVMNETGDHLMLTRLRHPLKVGAAIQITLTGRDGRTLKVSATVKKPGS